MTTVHLELQNQLHIIDCKKELNNFELKEIAHKFGINNYVIELFENFERINRKPIFKNYSYIINYKMNVSN